jgi:hypothetical protein
MDFNRVINGMIRAAKLDKDFYEEVEKDTSYQQDALMVVILASVAGALGEFLRLLFRGHVGAAFWQLIVTAVIGIAVYYLWALLVQFVGTRIFKGTGDFGEVSRALGFAWAPRVINILSFIPVLGPIVGFLAWIWSIATGFIAVRQSLDQDNTNAALTVIVSAIVAFLIQLLIVAIFAAIATAIGITAAAVTGALGQ